MPDPTCTATIHGSHWAYQHHGCRCPDTVALMRESWRRRPTRPYKPTGRTGGWSNRTDVDPLTVQLVTEDGHRLNLTAGERKQAIAELTARGWPAWRIAAHLGVTPRTVSRHRTAA